jgi:hypothetical protein
MTELERQILETAKPHVTVALIEPWHRPAKGGEAGDNPALAAAISCEFEGWLVRREENENRIVFAITSDGLKALQRI